MKNIAVTSSKEDKSQNINIVKQGKNNEEQINLNKNESLIKSDINSDKIKTKKKDFIKSINKEKTTVDKNLIKSNILNEKNMLQKTEAKSEHSLNLKISVKSQYILKEILLILGEKRKLNLLRYNKFYHKLMDINITNYQKLSSKIIIGGINGYGKEYETKNLNLIFEGYYTNGKRNGRGKEYDGDTIFEGEFLNGIKNGKGVEYNQKSILFEGEYLNGKKWNGIAKEYYYFKYSSDKYKLKFVGNYCDGVKIGIEYDSEGDLLFEGKYLDDKKWNGTIINNNGFLYHIKNGNGKVKRYSKDGILIFEGEYINGELNGKGKEHDNKCGKLIFEGEYLNGKQWNGKIKEYIVGNHDDCCGRRESDEWELEDEEEENTKNKNILKFEGEYLNGKRNGKGKEYDNDGKLIYEGEYLNGNRKEKKNNKNHFHKNIYVLLRLEGNLKNGLLDGIVKKYHKRGLEFEGEYLNGERNGKGKEYNQNDKLIFEGEYLDGKIWNGKGKEFDYKENLIFEGKYLNGKRWDGIIYNQEENLEFQIKNGNGKVKEIFNKINKTIFEGEYINGEKNGKFKQFTSYNKLELEGQYVNGKMNGKIIEYICSYKSESEYVNGKKTGLSKEYHEEKLIFEGYYLNGKKMENV